MEHGGGEFLTLSNGILNLERRWKLISSLVILMASLYGGNLELEIV